MTLLIKSKIDWQKVRHHALDLGVRSDRGIAHAAGLHPHSIGKEGPYLSTTLDKLAAWFDCQPTELVSIERQELEYQVQN